MQRSSQPTVARSRSALTGVELSPKPKSTAAKPKDDFVPPPHAERQRDAAKIHDLCFGAGAADRLLDGAVAAGRATLANYERLLSAVSAKVAPGSENDLDRAFAGVSWRSFLTLSLNAHPVSARRVILGALLAHRAEVAAAVRPAAAVIPVALVPPAPTPRADAGVKPTPQKPDRPAEPSFSHLQGLNRTEAALAFQTTGKVLAWALPEKPPALNKLGRPIIGLERTQAALEAKLSRKL